MKYLALYFAAGVIVLTVTLIQSRADKKKHGESIGDQLTELRLQTASAWTRFADKVIVPVLAGALVILAWPVAVIMFIKILVTSKGQEKAYVGKEFVVSKQDLLKKLTIEQIEEREMVDDPLGAVPDKPFGHLNGAWNEFLAKLKPQAELWSFRSTVSDFRGVNQVIEGYVIVENRKLGARFVTMRRGPSDDY